MSHVMFYKGAEMEHFRHRSFGNFLVNLLLGLIACSFLPNKPSTNYHTATDNQLVIFKLNSGDKASV
jgi:hypothetical protein